MSEHIPEMPSHELYNDLLANARELHFNAAVGQVYGQLTVNEHTDARTNMTFGDPWGTVLHFTTDILPAGVLLRRTLSTRDEDQRYIESDTVLLSAPYDSRAVKTTDYVMDKQLKKPSYDTDRAVATLKDSGVMLDEATALLWGGEIHALMADRMFDSPRRNQAGRRLGRVLAGRLGRAS